MDNQPIIVQARQPAITQVEVTGQAVTRSIFVISVIALFVAAIILNIVIEADIYMWLVTIFGAVVITIVLSAAGAHAFSRDRH